MSDIFSNILVSGLSGGTAVGIMNPLDTLRIRWQLVPPPERGVGIVRFARQIVRTEGLWSGLWKPACLTNSLSIATSAGIRVGIYPYARDAIRQRTGGSKSPALMAGTGFACGAVG